jgi:hypothetical protein
MASIYRPSLWARFKRAVARLVAIAVVIALVPLVARVAWDAQVARYNREHHITVSQPKHREPGVGSRFMAWALEQADHAIGRVDYDDSDVVPGVRKRRARPAPTPRFEPVTPAPIRFSLLAKRTVDGPHDTDLPPHPAVTRATVLWDFSHLGAGYEEHPDSTTLHFFLTGTVTSAKPVTATVGRLVMRDRAGRALHVAEWHFPDAPELSRSSVLAPGRVFHPLYTVARAYKHPRFQELLHTPLSDMRLEWSPYFTAYADGSMAGDAHAMFYIDDEGLPLDSFENGLYAIAAMQYPQEFPGATRHSIFPQGYRNYRPDGSVRFAAPKP